MGIRENPTGRIRMGWHAPGPKIPSIFPMYWESMLSGTKAWMVPAKPPPCIRHAPSPSSAALLATNAIEIPCSAKLFGAKTF